ncbi:MAG: hypothetical protein WC781_04040 [Candidatus Pacearchaeota archaeon]|jgi:hypothetical protein
MVKNKKWVYSEDYEERRLRTGLNMRIPTAYFWTTSNGDIAYKLMGNSLGNDNLLGTLQGVINENEMEKVVRAVCECQEKEYYMIFGKNPYD